MFSFSFSSLYLSRTNPYSFGFKSITDEYPPNRTYFKNKSTVSCLKTLYMRQFSPYLVSTVVLYYSSFILAHFNKYSGEQSYGLKVFTKIISQSWNKSSLYLSPITICCAIVHFSYVIYLYDVKMSMNNGRVNEQWICQWTMDMSIYNGYANLQWLCQWTMDMSKYKVVSIYNDYV